MSYNIFLYGGCVSRDIINLDKDNYFKLIDYYARSSVATLSSMAYKNDNALDNISSKFRRRMVKRDFEKSLLLEKEAILKSDVILIDFLVERNNLIVLPTGEILTITTELMESGLLSDVEFKNKCRLIKSGSMERRELWSSGINSFFSWLKSLGKLSNVVLNKVYWSSSFEEGSLTKFPVSQEAVIKANNELDWMYQKCSEWLEPYQFMSFSEDVLIADENHHWGVSPFHYVPAYYETALKKLKNITKLFKNAERTNPIVSLSRDIGRWGKNVKEFSSIEEFISEESGEDGLYQIKFDESYLLDVLLQNFSLMKDTDSRKILVCFSGAVSERNYKKAPFFSGIGISKTLGIPLVSVSDPTLAFNDDLSLAWYVGFESCINFPNHLARLLDCIAQNYNAELIIVGGSGGGFATLQLGTLLKTVSQLVVWNPQTNISNYSRSYVLQYLASAFPNLEYDSQEADLYKVLDSTGLRHDLKQYPLKKNIKLLYLQNQTDWHTEKHAGPYFRGGSFSLLGKRVFQDESNQLIVAIGDWGKGHVAPSKELILKVIKDFYVGKALSDVAIALEGNSDFVVDDSQKKFTCFNFVDEPRLSVFLETINEEIYVKAELSSNNRLLEGISYAFYLMVDGKRHAIRWYSDSSATAFTLPYSESSAEVIVFAKDVFGEKIIVKKTLP